jgi:hypothetical protein
MLEMIQFGAADVIRTSDGGSGEIDIDAVLSSGEKRTKEVLEQLESVVGKGEEVWPVTASRAAMLAV